MDDMTSSEAMEFLLKVSEELADIKHLQTFMENVRERQQDMTPFGWWESYLAWSEVSTRGDMENYYG